jgi:hypothetical protein
MGLIWPDVLLRPDGPRAIRQAMTAIAPTDGLPSPVREAARGRLVPRQAPPADTLRPGSMVEFLDNDEPGIEAVNSEETGNGRHADRH